MHDQNSETDIRFQELKLSYEPDFPEMLNCVLNINKSRLRTYLGLLRLQTGGVAAIADEIDRSRSTARQQILPLREKGLVERDTRVQDEGLQHTYQVVPLPEVKSLLHESLNRWTNAAIRRIETLDGESESESIEYRSAAESVSEDTSSVTTPESPEILQLGDELPSFRSVATCVFGFKYPEFESFLVLLDHPETTAEELAEIQGHAQTTAVTRLNALQDRGMVAPVARETEAGQIAYAYVPRPLDDLIPAMGEQFIDWDDYVHDRIDNFDESDLASVDYRD